VVYIIQKENKIMKKKSLKLLSVIILVTTLSIVLFGCNQTTVTAVIVSSQATRIAVGADTYATATVLGENDPPQDVIWTSSAGHIAFVSSTGVIMGVSEGTAIIQAASVRDSRISGSVLITVVKPIDHYVDVNLTVSWTRSGIINAATGNQTILTVTASRPLATTRNFLVRYSYQRPWPLSNDPGSRTITIFEGETIGRVGIPIAAIGLVNLRFDATGNNAHSIRQLCEACIGC